MTALALATLLATVAAQQPQACKLTCSETTAGTFSCSLPVQCASFSERTRPGETCYDSSGKAFATVEEIAGALTCVPRRLSAKPAPKA